MMKLKSRPVTCKCKRPHRVSRRGAFPSVSLIARPASPVVHRTVCESDEALSIALDRMIDDVLRARPVPIPSR